MNGFEGLRHAINGSIELSRLGKQQEALRLLDDAIADAIRDGSGTASISALCHHAAILCRFADDFGLVKHYYEQSLVHNPDNPRALYGLAEVALKQGNADLARQYAKKSYDATVQGDDEIAKRGLLDLITKQWPDVAK